MVFCGCSNGCFSAQLDDGVCLGSAFIWFFKRSHLPEWYFKVYIPVVITIALGQTLLKRRCLLTVFENYLRERSGRNRYEGTFIRRYSKMLAKFDVRNEPLDFAFCVGGIVVYGLFIQGIGG